MPELREVHNPYGDISQVTIRQLMSHSAGFRAATWPWGGDKPWHPFEPTQWAQLVAMFPYTELLFKPGTRVQLLQPRRHRARPHHRGALRRRLRSLRHQEHLHAARNDAHASSTARRITSSSHRSHSYVRTTASSREQRFDFDTGITVSNGGLNAPLDDMAKWLGFLMATRDGHGL